MNDTFMPRELEFDFGDKWIVERDGALWIKHMPEHDGISSRRAYRFVVDGCDVRVTQVNAEIEEYYADNWSVSVPLRVWRLALAWIEERLAND